MTNAQERAWLALVTALLAASCGGGGGGTPAAVTPPPPAVIGPTATSVSAATTTAQNNALCGASVSPYYWEIGDKSGALASGSIGTGTNGQILATTTLSIASSSKWLYSTYVTQLRGSAAALTANDIDFLHFTSGYSNMGDSSDSSTCPASLNPDTVNQCLTLSNPQGAAFSAQDPTTVGKFDYDGGHMENHASKFTALGDVVVGSLGQVVGAELGSGVDITYTEPLMSGGVMTSASVYAIVLQHILDGTLAMHDALGSNAVCTVPSATCNAAFTPFPQEAWHYSIGHWVEDNAATNGDGAFSSAGAFGFYPWIDATKTYYGILAREQQSGGAYASAQCGRLIRRAWITGEEQTADLPSD